MRRALPVFLLLLAAAGARAAASVPLRADLPAVGVTQLKFTGVNGEAEIGVSPDDAVHVKLDLEQQKVSFLWVFRWMSDSTARDLANPQLVEVQQGGVLSLSVAYPSGQLHEDVKQSWTVQVPARFMVDAAMGKGRLVIRGVAGGISARLEAGDLTIHIPGGTLKASTGFGRVHVISDTTQPGRLSVESTFGLAALSFNGKLYAPPPSNVHFFGNTELQQAGGKDDMDVRVTAGEADLRVGPVGDDKDYKGLFDDNDK